MSKNPDLYLLYEYSDKLPFTVRMKVCLDCTVDPEIPTFCFQSVVFRTMPVFLVSGGHTGKV